MVMDNPKNLAGEVEEGLLDIENILQMLELSLEISEEDEAIQRSIKIVRGMICSLLKNATNC